MILFLENADSKLQDFQATLTEFNAEATAIGKSKLDSDLEAIRQARKMVAATHSGKTSGGINLERVYSLVITLDDVTQDAAAWSSLILSHVCQGNVQGMRYVQFGMRTDHDFSMLNEVSHQLSHPTFRMMAASDEMINKMMDIVDKSSK